jgi:membrane-associated phospholipid phosphatase
VLVPAAYLGAPRARLDGLTRSMQLCALVAGSAFIVCPTTLAYPPPVDDGSLAVLLLQALAAADSSHNCLPSLHGALSLLALAALWDVRRPARNAALLAWGIAIGISIVMLRRHLFIDLGAGLLLGALAARLCAPRRERALHWWEITA